MDLSTQAVLARIRWPIYFIAIGLTVIPIVDFATSVLPVDIGNLRWRWSTLGLFTGFLFTPLFAIILVSFIASVLEDRVTQRVLAILNLVATGLIIAMLLLYALDTIQLRADLPEEDRLPFYMSSIRAAVKYGFTIIALLWLGVAGIKASRAERSSRTSRREVAPLVSGVGAS